MKRYYTFLLELCIVVASMIRPAIIQAQSLCMSSGQAEIFLTDVPEDWPVGAVLSHLEITGNDSQIKIEDVSKSDYLNFDPLSRNLTVTKQFNRTEMSFVDIQLACTMVEHSQNVHINVKIFILDVNNNPPVFVGAPYFVNVSEMTLVGTTIFQEVTATDADIDNSYITYEILSGPYSNYFDVSSPTRGAIILKEQLDYESNGEMDVVIVAKDNHPQVLGEVQPQLSSSALLHVTILDANDQNPVFKDAPYRATIFENDTVGTRLKLDKQIIAIDLDIGINSSIYYTLLPDKLTGSTDYFHIDKWTADISLREATLIGGTTYILLVKATETDNEDRYATTLVRVWVQPATSGAPRFLERQYSAVLVENTPVGSPVLTVTARVIKDGVFLLHQDSGSGVNNTEGVMLTYRFKEGQKVSDFEIDPIKGLIRTTNPLDHSRTSGYSITVEVTDGKQSDEVIVTIKVLNINKRSPVFSKQVYEFGAERRGDFFIGKVQATDEDADTVLAYSFAENITLFQINDDGHIYTASNADGLKEEHYKLVVKVTDDGIPPRLGFAVVNVMIEPEVGQVATSGMNQTQVDLVIVIVLAVLIGCLLLVIIILFVCLYKNKRGYHRASVYKPQSYEKTRKHNKPYDAYADEPQVIACKPSRHLNFYDDITLNNGSTMPQESPFSAESLEEPNIHRESNEPEYASVNRRPHRNGTTYPQNINSFNSIPSGMGELDYNTALAPLDGSTEIPSHGPLNGSTNGSVPSLAHSMTTYKGSNQPLMTVKGSDGRRAGSLAYIEDTPYSGSSQNSLENSINGSRRSNKPGITVYY